MTAHAYTEDRLVEQPDIELFAELGWQTESKVRSLGTTRDLLLPRLLLGTVSLE